MSVCFVFWTVSLKRSNPSKAAALLPFSLHSLFLTLDPPDDQRAEIQQIKRLRAPAGLWYLLREKFLLFRASSARRSSTWQTCSPEPDFSLEGGKSTFTPCTQTQSETAGPPGPTAGSTNLTRPGVPPARPGKNNK